MSCAVNSAGASCFQDGRVTLLSLVDGEATSLGAMEGSHFSIDASSLAVEEQGSPVLFSSTAGSSIVVSCH